MVKKSELIAALEQFSGDPEVVIDNPSHCAEMSHDIAMIGQSNGGSIEITVDC